MAEVKTLEDLAAQVQEVAEGYQFERGNKLVRTEVDIHYVDEANTELNWITVYVHLSGRMPIGGMFNDNIDTFMMEAFPREMLQRLGIRVQDHDIYPAPDGKYWFQLEPRKPEPIVTEETL